MKRIIPIILVLFLIPIVSFAHSGGTDSNGGHHDYNNVSGLGDYHYHHGYGPHLHPDGVCPYEGGSDSYDVSSNLDVSGSSDESYTMTYDELQEYVMQAVNDDPSSYDMVSIEEYEELQKEYELYEERHPEPEPFGLTEYVIIGVILFALIYSYYSLYKWGADHKAQIGKKFEEGYTKGYKNGYYAAEHKEEAEKISNILKKQ